MLRNLFGVAYWISSAFHSLVSMVYNFFAWCFGKETLQDLSLIGLAKQTCKVISSEIAMGAEIILPWLSSMNDVLPEAGFGAGNYSPF